MELLAMSAVVVFLLFSAILGLRLGLTHHDEAFFLKLVDLILPELTGSLLFLI